MHESPISGNYPFKNTMTWEKTFIAIESRT